MRSNFEPLTRDRGAERLLSPDLDPGKESKNLFHRAEPGIVQEYLPYIRPPVLYIFGDNSPISNSTAQVSMMSRTGVGLGGSGSTQEEQVAKIVLPKSGHLLPLEKVAACAEVVSFELSKRLDQFRSDELFLESHQSGKSERDDLVVSKEWQEGVKRAPNAKRPTRERL